jgi:hypothetical protein
VGTPPGRSSAHFLAPLHTAAAQINPKFPEKTAEFWRQSETPNPVDPDVSPLKDAGASGSRSHAGAWERFYEANNPQENPHPANGIKKSRLSLQGRASGLRPENRSTPRFISVLSASLRRYYPDQVPWVLSQALITPPLAMFEAIKEMCPFVNSGMGKMAKTLEIVEMPRC